MEHILHFIKNKWKILFAVCCVLLFVTIEYKLSFPSGVSSDNARVCANKLLEAIVNQDETKWQEAVHPVYGPTFGSSASLREEILSTGIAQGKYSLSSVVYENCEVSDGNAISAEYKLRISDGIFVEARCYLRVIYQESENGKGIVDVKVIDIPSMVID